jgi:hypothetical protein
MLAPIIATKYHRILIYFIGVLAVPSLPPPKIAGINV